LISFRPVGSPVELEVESGKKVTRLLPQLCIVVGADALRVVLSLFESKEKFLLISFRWGLGSVVRGQGSATGVPPF
jgi:hypothetical protein